MAYWNGYKRLPGGNAESIANPMQKVNLFLPSKTVRTFPLLLDYAGRNAVMENSEHWFHTDEQLLFLDQWMTGAVLSGPLSPSGAD